MTASMEVRVAGMGLFMPDFPTAADWHAQRRSAEPQLPSGSRLDRRARGRSSVLTKALAEAYFEAADAASVELGEGSAVFGSALGEVGTMLGLLNQMWRDREEPSPMAFALSVHNAASGVVSIATKNRGFTTSLGADHDTPAMALMEAIGLIAERGEPVVVVCGEEPTPTALVPDDESWELAAMAIALAPTRGDNETDCVRLRGPFKASATLVGSDLRAAVARNPQVGLLDLICAVEAGRSGTIALDRGRGGGWCMEVLCPDG
ncbi:MAG: beta-ketoacyl synthase chain length factor [Myxococcales bacterium]|nr:beta-ketoacyl synthase chain length factor [Myxococcales bacterium]